MGNLNPFRYRGYYFDTETGLYYLQSRYYDPETCRFVNADGYISTGQGFTGNNMFAYCLNSPVQLIDKTGTLVALANGCSELYINNLLAIKSHASNNVSNSLPVKGEPGSSQTLHNPDGTPKQKRWYGPDGNAVRDRDFNHPGKLPFPHDHEWKNGKRGKDHIPPSPEYKFSWEPIIGIGIVTVCSVGMVFVIANDATGVGILDNFLYGPLGYGIKEGLQLIWG